MKKKQKKQKGNNDELIKKISFYGTFISFILNIVGCVFIALDRMVGVVFLILGVFGFMVVMMINGKFNRYGDLIIEYGKEFGK